jgi:hypothetical protein
MTRPISRRRLSKSGLGAFAGLAGLGGGSLADRCGQIPANHNDLETLTFAGQRLLTNRLSMAGEFDRTQIPHQGCEEGWSFMAEWTGGPLSDVLARVGIRPDARFVILFAFDERWDRLDLDDALHPQTLLAYSMNGPEMLLDHGAPVRRKAQRHLGYNDLKYLRKVTVTDSAKGIGDGPGSGSPGPGDSWSAGT